MRLQVSVDPCGFCGMDGCIVQLTKKGNSNTIACSCKVPAVIPVQRRLWRNFWPTLKLGQLTLEIQEYTGPMEWLELGRRPSLTPFDNNEVLEASFFCSHLDTDSSNADLIGL